MLHGEERGHTAITVIGDISSSGRFHHVVGKNISSVRCCICVLRHIPATNLLWPYLGCKHGVSVVVVIVVVSSQTALPPLAGDDTHLHALLSLRSHMRLSL